jgi:hypothetical protein
MEEMEWLNLLNIGEKEDCLLLLNSNLFKNVVDLIESKIEKVRYRGLLLLAEIFSKAFINVIEKNTNKLYQKIVDMGIVEKMTKIINDKESLKDEMIISCIILSRLFSWKEIPSDVKINFYLIKDVVFKNNKGNNNILYFTLTSLCSVLLKKENLEFFGDFEEYYAKVYFV